jgi:hypothetical protein
MTDSQDESVQLMDDMDPRLLELLRTRINSFVKWDLVRFFHANPHTADTAEHLALLTERDMRVVEVGLRELAQAGVLAAETMADLPVYALTSDESMVALLDSFVRACDERQFRVKATYHIIRGLR